MTEPRDRTFWLILAAILFLILFNPARGPRFDTPRLVPPPAVSELPELPLPQRIHSKHWEPDEPIFDQLGDRFDSVGEQLDEVGEQLDTAGEEIESGFERIGEAFERAAETLEAVFDRF